MVLLSPVLFLIDCVVSVVSSHVIFYFQFDDLRQEYDGFCLPMYQSAIMVSNSVKKYMSGYSMMQIAVLRSVDDDMIIVLLYLQDR